MKNTTERKSKELAAEMKVHGIDAALAAYGPRYTAAEILRAGELAAGAAPRKVVVISNGFHQTEVTLRGQVDARGQVYLSDRQVRRARRELCGMSECACGGRLKERDGSGSDGFPTDSILIDGRAGRVSFCGVSGDGAQLQIVG